MGKKRRVAAVLAVLSGAVSGLGGCQTYTESGMTLPTPRYLQHYPQYFAPDPTFPLPRELASMEGAEAAGRPAGVGAAQPQAPSAPVVMPAGGP